MTNVVATVALFLPFVLILWLANLADRRRFAGETHHALALLTHGLLISFYMLLILAGLVLYLLGRLPGALSPMLLASVQEMGIEAADASSSLAAIGLGLWIPGVAAILLLLPPSRALLARLIPIERGRTVHAVALSYSMLIVSNLLVTVGWGLGSIAKIVETGSAGGASGIALGAWSQAILWAMMALLGVGWLSRRSLRETLLRLGLVWPSCRQAVAGLVWGVILVVVALSLLALAEMRGISVRDDVSQLTEALIGPLLQSLPGILTLGLAAALGEEAIFRGALQPRFGILPTALLFALLHSNYGLSLSTLVVLILGLMLGILRQRANTSAAMVAHAVYNMTLGLASYLGLF
jgi:membrane protease YdiL (CAAX protease family)